MSDLPSIYGGPDHWYILIGVNFYYKNPKFVKRNEFGKLMKITDLRGCVPDVNLVEKHLKERLGIPDDRIHKLTSTEYYDEETGDERPEEEGTPRLASYENIVNKFKEVTEKAQKGDIIHIHYSGHGGVAKTQYGFIKGANAQDETLCPCDVIKVGGRHIRDIEVAYYIHKMVEKNLHVTLVMDSCHSGGVREVGDPNNEIRRLVGIDNSEDYPAIPEAELRAALGTTFEDAGKDYTPSENVSYLMEPIGFEVMAACRFDQLAGESAVDVDPNSPKVNHGWLTWYLVQTLEELKDGKPITHLDLFESVKRKMDLDQRQNQTPVFSGMGSRLLFDSRTLDEVPGTYPVRNYSPTRFSFTIGAGRVHGFTPDTELLLFPWNQRDFKDISDSTPRLRVITASEFTCTAKYIKGSVKPNSDDVLKGYRVLKRESPIPKIRIRPTEDLVSAEDKLEALQRALQKKREETVKESLGCPVTLVSDDDNDPVAYHLGLTAQQQYQLREIDGSDVIGFPPVEKADDLLISLTHVAKFCMIRDLQPLKTTVPFNQNYSFRVINGEKYQHGETYRDGVIHTIPSGEPFEYEFKNNTDKPVNICVLNLNPGWGISLLYPGQRADYETVPALEFKRDRKKLSCPPEQSQKKPLDILKVLVFDADTNFKALVMPKITDANRSVFDGGASLLQMLKALKEGSRDVVSTEDEPADEPWSTGNLYLRIQAPPKEETPPEPMEEDEVE